jgi:hypothetical protein
MAVLRELLEAGKITPIVDSAYPLSEAREALRHMIEDEIQGKVLWDILRRQRPSLVSQDCSKHVLRLARPQAAASNRRVR